MAEQASKLQDEAARATGPQSRHLGEVASKLQDAASSGQLPDLQPGTEGGATPATRAARAYQANSHPHLGGVQQLLVGMASELASVLSGAT